VLPSDQSVALRSRVGFTTTGTPGAAAFFRFGSVASVFVSSPPDCACASIIPTLMIALPLRGADLGAGAIPLNSPVLV
jgi:hypothetical protein